MSCLEYILLFMVIMTIIEICTAVIPYVGLIIFILVIIYLLQKIRPIEKYRLYKLRKFEEKYYVSEEFRNLKNSVSKYIFDCNELNEHITNLQDVHVGINQTDYGNSYYYDNSFHNYSRPEYSKHSIKCNVYNCSRNICDSARQQPFKYICKYFDIKPTAKTLEEFETLLNSYEAAIDGMRLLNNKKAKILTGIYKDIPQIIKSYGYENFQRYIGFKDVLYKTIEFPSYKFLYVSSGGYASTECTVVMDIENLNKFIKYLSEKIKFNESVAGQRALMTSLLRRKILARDKYTCQKCGNSTHNEPNLLLEIDHIIPLAKGGKTTENNLQVLCWRCNRHKGSKVE